MVVTAFTPEQREQLIFAGINSKSYKGHVGPYSYQIIPKMTGFMDIEDVRKASATKVLAETIYQNEGRYRVLSLGLYEVLLHRIECDHMLRHAYGRDMVMMVKGGNAYAMLVPGHPDLPYSDLDIAIFINPCLPDELFNEIAARAKIAVFQAMSMHKKMLDNVLFADNADPDLKYRWFNDEQIQAFKQRHIEQMFECGLVSPFVDKEVRNYCSRNSFILANSNVYDDKVVRVEVPHFEKAERIPLRKSPIFCSYNKTIKFDNDNGLHREFELYRMRWNNMALKQKEVRVSMDVTEHGVKMDIIPCQDERVTADFIDITIPGKNDCELVDFWTFRQFVGIFDPIIKAWVHVPPLFACIQDLQKMLTVYDCPESKREKRVRKMKVLREVYESWFAQQQPPM